MKKMKVLVSVLLAMVMLLSAAAFAEYSVDTLEVKIWDNNQLAGLQEIADLWTEQSGVKVNIQVVDWNNYWTLLEAGARRVLDALQQRRDVHERRQAARPH